jgi:hypothetical protein
MLVPRYRRDRQQPNNVASIWLLRGKRKHVCFHDAAIEQQRHFVPPRCGFFADYDRILAELRDRATRCDVRLAET